MESLDCNKWNLIPNPMLCLTANYMIFSMKSFTLNVMVKLKQFNPNKIYNAINKARLETNEFEQDETETVRKETIKLINTKHNPRNDLSVEEIQDYVEEALMILDKVKTAKAYILYRAEKAKQRKRDLFKSRKSI